MGLRESVYERQFGHGLPAPQPQPRNELKSAALVKTVVRTDFTVKQIGKRNSSMFLSPG